MIKRNNWRALNMVSAVMAGRQWRPFETLTRLESSSHTVEFGASGPTRRTAELKKEPR